MSPSGRVRPTAHEERTGSPTARSYWTLAGAWIYSPSGSFSSASGCLLLGGRAVLAQRLLPRHVDGLHRHRRRPDVRRGQHHGHAGPAGRAGRRAADGRPVVYGLAEDAAGPAFFVDQAAPDATVAATPLHQEMEKLRGRIGKTLAPLRPAGVADFDGRRVDVITEGMMVDGGQWVRCIDVRAGQVVVRPVEKPDDLGDLDDDLFH